MSAPYRTWLTPDGRCRQCLGEGRDAQVARRSIRSGGDGAKVRHDLINHCRGWHPVSVRLIEEGVPAA